MLRKTHLASNLLLFAAILAAACAPVQRNQPANLQTVTIGMDSTAVNSLILIADSQNYFSANGLKVSIKTYPSGLAAVEGMLKNEVDVTTASEFVLVGKAFTNAPLLTWGSIDKFMHNYLIARRDRGIQSEQDLRGKRIGVPLKTAAEFYLGRFLELHHMSLKDVIPVDTSPNDLVQALVNGTVDAVVAWQPNEKAILDQMGSSVIRWPVQNDQAAYGIVISTQQWTKQHPESVKQFLRALVEAESFYVSHPQKAMDIVQKRLSFDKTLMEIIRSEHQYQVSLDQSLILAMEDEARWMISNGIVPDQQTPVFLNYIYVDGMQSVRPDAMNIIH